MILSGQMETLEMSCSLWNEFELVINPATEGLTFSLYVHLYELKAVRHMFSGWRGGVTL